MSDIRHYLYKKINNYINILSVESNPNVFKLPVLLEVISEAVMRKKLIKKMKHICDAIEEKVGIAFQLYFSFIPSDDVIFILNKDLVCNQYLLKVMSHHSESVSLIVKLFNSRN